MKTTKENQKLGEKFIEEIVKHSLFENEGKREGNFDYFFLNMKKILIKIYLKRKIILNFLSLDLISIARKSELPTQIGWKQYRRKLGKNFSCIFPHFCQRKQKESVIGKKNLEP